MLDLIELDNWDASKLYRLRIGLGECFDFCFSRLGLIEVDPGTCGRGERLPRFSIPWT